MGSKKGKYSGEPIAPKETVLIILSHPRPACYASLDVFPFHLQKSDADDARFLERHGSLAVVALQI